jgi:hypothetical protein
VDLDGDGRHDILSGSYSRTGGDESMAGLFQVLRGQPDGTFKSAEALNGTDDKPLIIPVEEKNWIENICTRPFAVDWDGDGHLDLVVGNFAGTFFLFKGEGQGKFRPEPEQIKAGNKPLQIEGNHSDPFVVDWDGDGDLDVLSGSSQGGVQWAENRAGPGKPPRLQSFRPLIKARTHADDGDVLSDEDLTGPASDMRIWVDDVNSDGKLDLLVGDTVNLVSPAKGLSEKEFKEKYAEWKKSFAKASEEVNSEFKDEKAEEEARERFQKIYEARSKIMKEERTGFVWLYLRK